MNCNSPGGCDVADIYLRTGEAQEPTNGFAAD